MGNQTRSVINDVLAERNRQIEREGYSAEHDDDHGDDSLAVAAACYALDGTWLTHISKRELVDKYWPWDMKDWKPKDARRNLVRAAALIVAEIERLDRAAPKGEVCNPKLPEGAVPVLKAARNSASATGETGDDRPAAPLSSTPRDSLIPAAPKVTKWK